MNTLKYTGKYTSATVFIDTIEAECIRQIHTFLSHPAFTNQIAIMPDTHAGKGSVIGFTMPFTDKIIPTTIGVDIGCGMLSTCIGDSLNISKSDLDDYIRATIPMGMNVHKEEIYDMKNQFPWKDVSESARLFIMKYNRLFNTHYDLPEYSFDWYSQHNNDLRNNAIRASASIGTLGGGNHFIEIGQSTITGKYWITVHSGSRNFGKVICEYHQGIAEKNLNDKRYIQLKNKIDIIKQTEDQSKIKSLIENAKKEIGIDFTINIKGLEYLEGDDAMNYFIDMIFAQKYAEVNRKEMMNRITSYLMNYDSNIKIEDTIESIHNFIDFKDFIIRKGAIRSYINERMIIPFNMRDGLIICKGKSNAEWNYSAPHGAGRIMSRSNANKSLNLDEFTKSMEGIFSTSVCQNTIDESPQAYKDSATIERAIKDTATIIDRIKPVLNIKDKSSNDRRYKK